MANIEELARKLNNSTDYADVYNYASEYALERVKAIREYEAITPAELSTEIEDIKATVNSACFKVQRNKNKAVGIGLKPRVDNYTIDDIRELVEGILQGVEFTAEEKVTVDTLALDVLRDSSVKQVDRVQKKNIRLITNSGLKITVTRIKEGWGGEHTNRKERNCQFCASHEGVKVFDSYFECVNDPIWERHQNCTCTIDYVNNFTGTRARI